MTDEHAVALAFAAGVLVGAWLVDRRDRPWPAARVTLRGGPRDGEAVELGAGVAEYRVVRADEDGNPLGPEHRYVRTAPAVMVWRGSGRGEDEA